MENKIMSDWDIQGIDIVVGDPIISEKELRILDTNHLYIYSVYYFIKKCYN